MKEFTEQDNQFMQRALDLAKRGRYSTDPNPRVGCVLVADSYIIGEGWHQYAGGPHAEIVALKSCAALTTGATAYVTLEPCAHVGRTGPCCDALIEAGVSEVVVAMLDPNPEVNGQGIKRMEAAGLRCRVGLKQDEARRMNAGFVQRMSHNRPWVRLKIAASLDGATALGNGRSKWITNDAARADVHELRASSSAILTGVGTVVADNPHMNARFQSEFDIQQPLPIVLDTNARAPQNAKIFSRSALVFVGPEVATIKHQNIDYQSVSISKRGGLDLHEILAYLAKKQLNEVMVEAGPTLCGSFLAEGLIDEIVVYQAPIVMGTGTRGMFNVGPFDSMDQVTKLQLVQHEFLGDCSKQVFTVGG